MKLPVSNTVLTLMIGAFYAMVINQITLNVKSHIDELEVKGANQSVESHSSQGKAIVEGTPLLVVSNNAKEKTATDDGVVDLEKLFNNTPAPKKVVEAEKPKPQPKPNYLRMLAAGLTVTAIGDRGAVINGTYYTLNEPMEDVVTGDGKHPILKNVTLEGAEIAVDGKSAPVRWLILDDTI